MSYTQASIPQLTDGETGYQLDTGDLVAVSYKHSRDCQPNHIGLAVTARWVDAQGNSELDHGGQPVVWEQSHSALQSGIATGNPTPADYLKQALDFCIQGGADGALPGECHPDGGVRARIQAIKALRTILPQ